ENWPSARTLDNPNFAFSFSFSLSHSKGKDLAVMRKQRIQVVVELCKAILNFSPEIDEKNCATNQAV
uniref:Uncharacterized protein n=1 Tax=Anolis carolinensis TaxID=28377 RepID=A0A803TPY5_ANOCA